MGSSGESSGGATPCHSPGIGVPQGTAQAPGRGLLVLLLERLYAGTERGSPLLLGLELEQDRRLQLHEGQELRQLGAAGRVGARDFAGGTARPREERDDPRPSR